VRHSLMHCANASYVTWAKLWLVIYQWDARKAAANLKKHGVSFEEAATVFGDALALTYPDPDHSVDDRREITSGHTNKTATRVCCSLRTREPDSDYHCPTGDAIGTKTI
jgi:uncharacterized DUF497 family protein